MRLHRSFASSEFIQPRLASSSRPSFRVSANSVVSMRLLSRHRVLILLLNSTSLCILSVMFVVSISCSFLDAGRVRSFSFGSELKVIILRKPFRTLTSSAMAMGASMVYLSSLPLRYFIM